MTTKYHFARTRANSRVARRAPPLGGAFSVNGTLQPMTAPVPTDSEGRGDAYKPVEIGKPLVVRYKYFNLITRDVSNDLDKILISTFVKTEAQKSAASEAVTYFNPNLNMKDRSGRLSFDSWGARDYGHEVIYYTKSYLGQTLKTTLQVYELDSASRKVFEGLKSVIRMGGNVPLFKEYLPTLIVAERGIDIVRDIINWFDKDDPVIRGDSLDLFFQTPHSQILQSGRYVVVHGLSDDELVGGAYGLSDDNRLERDGQEVTDLTYYVFQVNAQREKGLEDFDHFQGAAEILGQVNRGGGMGDLVESLKDVLKAASDVAMFEQMQDLSLDLDDAGAREEFDALVRGLSPEMRAIADSWIKEKKED